MDIFDRRACQLGEGPYWDDRTGRVGWVDILGRSVLWREFGRAGSGSGSATGDTGAIATPGHVGAAVPREGGGLVLCLPGGPMLLDSDGGRTYPGTFADADAAAGRPPTGEAQQLRANDAKADPAGRLWLGTMAYDETPGAGALYRLDPGAAAPARVLDGVTISNGLGWSPDGTLMYYVDTPDPVISVFDYDLSTGAISGRRAFAEVEPGGGAPDGLCVDAAGGVWVALWGGGAVRRYAPDGTLDRVVEVGTPRTTSCAFAGPDLDQLIITSASVGESTEGAGLTYVHRPGDVVGLPLNRFAG